jgi:hypothetical protein
VAWYGLRLAEPDGSPPPDPLPFSSVRSSSLP